MLAKPKPPKRYIGFWAYLSRNLTVMRSRMTLTVRSMPYLDSPWMRGWWATPTSVTRAPCQAAWMGMKRCISP